MKKIIQSYRRPQQQQSHPHACSIAFCDPLNEIGLMGRNIIPPGPTTLPDNLYVCKYGQVHECLPSTCMAAEVCPVSGASYGVIDEYGYYDPNDSRTWGKGNSIAPVVSDVVLPKIEALVDTILFSPARQRIQNDFQKLQTKRAKKEQDSYVLDCKTKHVPINILTLLMIESNISGGHSITTPPRDRDIIAKYTGYVLQVYKNAQTFIRDKISVEAITLATLYKMQQGMVVNDVAIFPLEPYLVEHLPLMNDLPKFKINKKSYTLGERLIFLMLENARRQGKSDQELAIVVELRDEETLYTLGGDDSRRKSSKWVEGE